MNKSMFGMMTHMPTAQLYIYTRQGIIAEATLRKENMTLIIPDRNKESQEDFIWALPVEHVKWNKWYDLSKQFKCVTPTAHGGVRYMNRMEGKDVKTVVLLPTDQQSDDDVLTSAAWLRMIKQLSCRIYVIRAGGRPLSRAETINAVVGIDPDTLQELEDEEEKT